MGREVVVVVVVDLDARWCPKNGGYRVKFVNCTGWMFKSCQVVNPLHMAVIVDYDKMV